MKRTTITLFASIAFGLLASGCTNGPAVNEWYDVAPGVQQRVTDQGVREQICTGEEGFTWLAADLRAKLDEIALSDSPATPETTRRQETFEAWLSDTEMSLKEYRDGNAEADGELGNTKPLALEDFDQNSQCTVTASISPQPGYISGSATVFCGFWFPQNVTASVTFRGTTYGGTAWGWNKQENQGKACTTGEGMTSHASAYLVDASADGTCL